MTAANVVRPRSFHGAIGCAGIALVGALAYAGSAAAQVTELQIAPSQLQIQPGEQKSVLVTAFDAAGNVVTDAEFTWSADASIVQVTRDDTAPNILYVEGLARGRVSMTVISNDVSAVAEINVAGADLTGIPEGSGETAVLRIEPETIFLLPTEEVQLLPMFLREDGSPAARSNVTWRSLLETVSTVNNTGLVVGISPGQGVIEAEAANGVVGRALVRVDNAPLAFGAQRLSLAPLDSDTLEVLVASQENRRVRNRQLRWGSSDPSVVNVSPLGVVTGIKAGTANVVIRGFGQQHEIPVTVHRRVASMDIAPPRGDITVPLGGFMDFEAVLQADDGTPIPEAPVVWENSDTSVAVLNRETGRLTGVAQGVTTLSATGPEEGLRAEWVVNVVAGGIVIDYEPQILSKGQTVSVPVWIHDTDGNRLQPADAVTWSTGDSLVATVMDNTLEAVGWGATHVVAATAWGGVDSIHAIVQGELLVTSTRSGSSDIYSAEPEALDDLNPVTSEAGAELDGAYSPDGRRIAYVATGDASNTDLYIVNTDGSDQRRLTVTDGNEGSPGWLGDGRIVYQLTNDGISQIWALDPNTASVQQLTASRRSSDQPAASPEGNRIAFRLQDQIHLIGQDGVVTQVTEEGRHRNPHWFPDGSLGYIAERRVDRVSGRVIVKHDLNGGATIDLTPLEWPIIDWAVAADGETFALVVQQKINEVLTQGLWVVRISDGVAGEPVEMPRAIEQEQFLFPSFRR